MSQNYFLFSELLNYSKAAQHPFLHSPLVNWELFKLFHPHCRQTILIQKGVWSVPLWPRDTLSICPDQGLGVGTKGKAVELPPFFSPTPGWYSLQMLQWQRKKEKKGRCPALGRRGLYLVEGLQPCSSAAPHRGLLRRNALSSAACKAGKSQ